MAEYHPDRDDLECFARGETLAETERWILEHLRSGCPICQRTVDALLPCPELLPARESRQPGEPRWTARPLRGVSETDSNDPSRARRSALRNSDSRAAVVRPLMSPTGNPPRRLHGALASTTSPRGSALSPILSRRPPETEGAARPPRRDPWTVPGAGPACAWDGAPLRRSAGTPPDAPEDIEVENEVWDRMFAKLEQRIILAAAERAAAPRLLADLLQRPVHEWRALVHASRRFQSLAICDLLLDMSLEAGCRDSSEATALAQLGILIADQLDVRHYGAAMVHDMKARAWAFLGDARRLGGDFAGAEQALAFAESLAEDGSADPLEEARLLDLKALLLSDQGWFEEAAELLDTVIEIYDDVKDLHREGRALIAKGICLGRSGWPQLAVELIPQGLALLDRELEPRLAWTARHELAWFLAESGSCTQAQRQLDAVRKDLPASEDPRTELCIEWLEARIDLRSRRWQEAEPRLDSVLQRFVAGGHGYEAALVMLDLAGLHLEQGKRSAIQDLAEDVLPVVLSLDVHRQAAAALVSFQQAAEDDRVTRALLADIAAYLQRARKNPRLSFQLAA